MPKTKTSQLNRDIALALANKSQRRIHATVKIKSVTPMGDEDYKILGLLKKARLARNEALASMCNIALQADEDNPAVQAAVAYCKKVLKS
jgi:hypothetical protein